MLLPYFFVFFVVQMASCSRIGYRNKKMMLPYFWQWLLLIGLLLLLIGPPVMALTSKEAHGGSKAVWVLLSAGFSLIGYVAYYFLVVKRKRS